MFFVVPKVDDVIGVGEGKMMGRQTRFVNIRILKKNIIKNENVVPLLYESDLMTRKVLSPSLVFKSHDNDRGVIFIFSPLTRYPD